MQLDRPRTTVDTSVVPHYIVKLTDADGDWYFEYSTIVDAPVTHALSRTEFEAYYLRQYGEQGMRNLPDRLTRVEARGTSAHSDTSAEDTLAVNRAGPDETHLEPPELLRQLRAQRPAVRAPVDSPAPESP
jgi:hypothetical protein